jgi:hypothetical protein
MSNEDVKKYVKNITQDEMDSIRDRSADKIMKADAYVAILLNNEKIGFIIHNLSYSEVDRFLRAAQLYVRESKSSKMN